MFFRDDSMSSYQSPEVCEDTDSGTVVHQRPPHINSEDIPTLGALMMVGESAVEHVNLSSVGLGCGYCDGQIHIIVILTKLAFDMYKSNCMSSVSTFIWVFH